jgi:hypothetical protein
MLENTWVAIAFAEAGEIKTSLEVMGTNTLEPDGHEACPALETV